MNRYITLLLVLLAATGSEAQALKSALAASDGDIRIEEILSPEQLRAIDADIMSVLKGLQHECNGGDTNLSFYFQTSIVSPQEGELYALAYQYCAGWSKPKGRRLLFVESAISIRAPSFS